MREIYKCPDGREAVIRFNEDALVVTVTTQDDQEIGRFRFELVNDKGEPITLIEDEGLPASLKLAGSILPEEWRGQGITERVVSLVCDETTLSIEA